MKYEIFSGLHLSTAKNIFDGRIQNTYNTTILDRCIIKTYNDSNWQLYNRNYNKNVFDNCLIQILNKYFNGCIVENLSLTVTHF